MRHPIVEEDLRAIAAEDLPWDALGGRRLLVSGAAGLMPACMIETLLHLNDTRGLGVRVVALVRDRARAEARFAGLLGRGDLELLIGDLGRALPPLRGADVIVHAASQASPAYYDIDPVGTLLPNAVGTAALLELARESRAANFLYFSSGEVYGQPDPARMPLSERDCGVLDPLALRSCYAESKRMGETMCVAWHHQHGVPARIVRPFHTYGPGMRLGDGRVYADFVADVVAGRDIAVKGDGSARRAFCYLSDAVRGIFTVLLKGAEGEAYNIGDEGGECGVLELAGRLAGLFPEKGLKVVRRERPEGDRYAVSPVSRVLPSTAKARALGWRPAVGLDEGFLRTVRSFQ